jgi:NAD(P)H-dependent flavin oxidoreductase YrpB (nitropropane dioxygenase family)
MKKTNELKAKERVMLHTYLTTSWHLRYPIIGAPMAYEGRGRLARAVSQAGGLGKMGIGSTEPVEFLNNPPEMSFVTWVMEQNACSVNVPLGCLKDMMHRMMNNNHSSESITFSLCPGIAHRFCNFQYDIS